jgi:hypothetical protein
LLKAEVLPNDSTERQLFQADAWIFTDGLLGLHQGPQKLRSFLSELGAQKVASNTFWKVYRDDFPNATALEKWWSMELVRHTSRSVAQDLSAEDTQRSLSAILVTKLGPVGGRRGMPGETDVAIDDLWQYTGAPWLTGLLKFKIDRVGALRGVAHPLSAVSAGSGRLRRRSGLAPAGQRDPVSPRVAPRRSRAGCRGQTSARDHCLSG